MKKPPREIKDAPIADKVDPEAIRANLLKDNLVDSLAREGAILLQKTNQPNVITLAEFLPFVALFKMGEKEQERYKTDPVYEKEMKELYIRYIRELGINLYEPTVVIRSKEDPVKEVVLNRLFTRIKSDLIDGRSHKELVPATITRNPTAVRDQELLKASISDLMVANRSEEQIAYFNRVQDESILIQGRFISKNMSADTKQRLFGDTKKENSPDSPTDTPVVKVVTFDDDDD